jgi:hypothetical protein
MNVPEHLHNVRHDCFCRENLKKKIVYFRVTEPHHFYAAPGENFDVVPASTLLYYSKPKMLKILNFLRSTVKVSIRSAILFSSDSV